MPVPIRSPLSAATIALMPKQTTHDWPQRHRVRSVSDATARRPAKGPVADKVADTGRVRVTEASGRRDHWLAVWSIALGSFALVFSELIPVGLLPDIGTHLHVSTGVAGLMVVMPAICAAISAPLLTLGAVRVGRRVLLRGITVLVLASDLVAAAAPNFTLMLVARALLGVCIGGFWVFGASAAMALVRAEVQGTAIAIVSGGIFVATVAALPLASLIGNLTSWRVAFLVASGLALTAIVFQLIAIPRLAAGKPVAPRMLLTIVRIPAARTGLIAAAAIFFADFAAYTYFNPLLHQRAGLVGGQITLVLLGFGVAGAITNFGAGITVREHLRLTLLGSGVLIAISTLLMAVISGASAATIALALIWGAGFGAVPVAVQTWTARTMPANIEGGLALFVTALQGSLAAGSALGGAIFNAYGPSGPLVVAAVVATLGSAVLLTRVAAVDRPGLTEDSLPDPHGDTGTTNGKVDQ